MKKVKIQTRCYGHRILEQQHSIYQLPIVYGMPLTVDSVWLELYMVGENGVIDVIFI